MSVLLRRGVCALVVITVAVVLCGCVSNMDTAVPSVVAKKDPPATTATVPISTNNSVTGNAMAQAAKTDADSVLFTYTAHTVMTGTSVTDGTKIIVCKSQHYYEFTYAVGLLTATAVYDHMPAASELEWKDAPSDMKNTHYVEVTDIDGMLAGTAVFTLTQE